MNLNFLSSRTMTWYMARMFLVRFVSVLGALVIVLMALDLLGESGKILAYPGNGEPQVWHYVGLRVPQIIARFLPFSALLATLITLATLNQHSEVIAMKAAGISAHQILAPLVLASIGVAAVSFAFNDRIVTRATSTLNAWQAANYGPIPRGEGVKGDVWVREGGDLIHARIVAGKGRATRLEGVSVYVRDGSRLDRIVTTDTATQLPDGTAWQTGPAHLFDVARNARREVGPQHFGAGISADRFTLSNVAADELPFMALRKAIVDLKAAGRPVDALEAGLWHKISGPMSAILMPLLAGVAAFGTARSGRLFIRAVVGMALGFAYFVADNFALAMGNLGAYPAFLAAWAPFLLFLMIGETVLIRTEE